MAYLLAFLVSGVLGTIFWHFAIVISESGGGSKKKPSQKKIFWQRTSEVRTLFHR